MMPPSARGHRASKLFEGFEDSSIWSALGGKMGSVLTDREDEVRTAIVCLGEYLFLAGEPNETLFEQALSRRGDYILVPRAGSGWDKLIERRFPESPPITRYGISKETQFDRAHLTEAAKTLPDGYEFRFFDAELYDMALSEEWSECFVDNFASREDFLASGGGVGVMHEGALVAGCSTFSSYVEGVEIQVATHPDYRKKGLAYACSARFILDCLDKGLYPSWDAANVMSLGLAKKLGYTPAAPYIGYEITI